MTCFLSVCLEIGVRDHLFRIGRDLHRELSTARIQFLMLLRTVLDLPVAPAHVLDDIHFHRLVLAIGDGQPYDLFTILGTLGTTIKDLSLAFDIKRFAHRQQHLVIL